jgi:hypothetical protein
VLALAPEPELAPVLVLELGVELVAVSVERVVEQQRAVAVVALGGSVERRFQLELERRRQDSTAFADQGGIDLKVASEVEGEAEGDR